MCPCHVPTGVIGRLIRAGERQFRPCLAGVAAHQLPAVIGGNVFLFGRERLVQVFVSFVLGMLHAGRFVVECQADGVENGCLACTGFAANQEKGFFAQRTVLEVDDGIFYGGKVLYGEFLEFHVPDR